MIRPAENKDLPELVDMLVDFQAEAGCYRHIDPCKESLSRFLEQMLERPDIAPIAIYESVGDIWGATALVVSPSWFNDQQLAGQELFWYIKPEHRGRYGCAMRLFNWLENWAKDHNLKSLTIAHTATMAGKLSDFYERRGFVAADVFYIKEVR